MFGAWRSLVAHLLWEQGVGGSNPLAPTSQFLILPMVTLYVMKGKAGKRYVGITNNLSRRFQEHRLKNTKGGQLLEEFLVLLTEEFPDYKTARIKEKFLKSGQGRSHWRRRATLSVAHRSYGSVCRYKGSAEKLALFCSRSKPASL